MWLGKDAVDHGERGGERGDADGRPAGVTGVDAVRQQVCGADAAQGGRDGGADQGGGNWREALDR